MSKLGIVGATALSLALAVATPAFAAGVHGGGAMLVSSGGFHGALERDEARLNRLRIPKSD
jgi:hypothetical protein